MGGDVGSLGLGVVMAEAPGLVFALILAGPAVGSFLALFADRWPRGEDVVSAPSRCRACGTRLTLRDRIPLLSWLALRGRCRHCGRGISARLFGAEAVAAVLPMAAVAVAPTPLALLFGCVFLWLLLGLALCDLAAYRLPDPLVVALAVCGVAMAWEHPGRALWDAALGALIGGGVLWLLRAGYFALRGRQGLGLGDVKLAGALGVALGATALPLVALIGALSGLAAALLVSARRGRSLRADSAVPFGIWLCFGAGCVWFLNP